MARREPNILCIGDAHSPFIHIPSARRAITYASDADIIIQMGDLFDLFGQSRFPKRLFMTPAEEISEGRILAEEMWKKIRKEAPKAKLFQIKGNHDERASKRMLEKAPELEPFCRFDDFWTFDGVETIQDSRDHLEINGTVFTHGHRSKIGDLIQECDFMNVVAGHSHTGGVYYRRLKSGKIAWELNCGYIANPFDEALVYRPMKGFFRWTHGVGWIDAQGPRFIPFEFTKEELNGSTKI
jgi:predicted phosphodiesterase